MWKERNTTKELILCFYLMDNSSFLIHFLFFIHIIYNSDFNFILKQKIQLHFVIVKPLQKRNQCIIHFSYNYFFSFPSFLVFHNISSMHAAASSAVSCPQTGGNKYILCYMQTMPTFSNIKPGTLFEPRALIQNHLMWWL